MAPLVWTLPEVRAWKKFAEQTQLDIRETLYGDREYFTFESTEKSLLREKIMLAIFGPPVIEDLSTKSTETTKTPKTTKKEAEDKEEEKEKKLTKIFNLVCKQNEGQNSFHISFLCIECLTRENNFVSPVIRLHLTDDATKLSKSVYIDNVPRAYEDFNDYLENNKLPKCLMCYPASGSYYLHPDDEAAIDFRKSPACDIIKAVLKGTDASSTVLGVGATGLCVASIFAAPLAIPAVTVGTLVASGAMVAYAVGRSIGKLHNRRIHGQTLGLRSPEARNCWFVIVGAAAAGVGVGAAAGIGHAAKLGVQISGTVARVPIFISVSVSGMGVVNNIANIVQKLKCGDKLDVMDGVYLAASVFLFTNVMVSAFQVNAIITEMTLNGDNPGNIFKDLTSTFFRENSEFEYLGLTSAVLNLTTFGVLFNPRTNTDDFSICFHSICKLISETAKKFVRKLLTAAGYAKVISSLLQEFCFKFAHEMECVANWYCKITGHTSLGGVFGQITQRESWDVAHALFTMGGWLCNHVSGTVWQCSGENMRVHNELASMITLHEEIGSVRPEDGAKKYAEEFEAACTLVKLEHQRQKANHEENYKRIKEFLPALTKDDFNKKEQITGSLDEYFWKKALAQTKKEFSGNENLWTMAVGLLSASPGSSGLEDPETGTRVHLFTRVQPAESDQQLSRDQYLSVAREVVGSVLDGAILEVDADTRMGIFGDVPANDEGISCVVVKCVPEQGFVSGIVSVVKL